MTIGERIAALREDKDLTQEELADQLHVVRSTISSYENGGIQPSYNTLSAMADFFDVSLDYLFGRTRLASSTKILEGRLSGERLEIALDDLFALSPQNKDTVIKVIEAFAASEKLK